MRSPRLLLIAAGIVLCGCGPELPRTGAVAAANCLPLPGSSASSEVPIASNGTPLPAEPLLTPTSAVHLSFVSPQPAEEVPLEARAAYSVRIECEAAEPNVLIDVALDGGRPRRLPATLATVELGSLVAAGEELSAGPHWLFAAAVVGSDLVPRPAPGSARAAVARRFFIGKPPLESSGPTGAVWLRKPEGTYNGRAAADAVSFDAFVFSVVGAPLEVPYTVALHGPTVSGELRLPSPFTLRVVPSGDYEVVVSAAAAKPFSTRFAVNRELSGAP